MGSNGKRAPRVSEASDLRALLERCGALLKGHFALSSGLHSTDYVQCALLLERPSWAEQVGEDLANRLLQFSPESIVSPALGGLVIGYEVASHLRVPFRFAERHRGEMTVRRGFGFRPRERIAVVEDVVTTGRSTLVAIAAAEHLGAETVAVGSIIDRTPGPNPFSVPFVSLLRLELEVAEPEECALCRAGGRAERPGSGRRSSA
jgi:orotate phosphoribosyltransferase